jgi:hypothetical protein
VQVGRTVPKIEETRPLEERADEVAAEGRKILV